MIQIRTFTQKDTQQGARLIHRTYTKFCMQDATQEANARYRSQYDTQHRSIEKLETEFLRSQISFVAEEDGEIIGIIRGGTTRIGNLFVDERSQRKGVARMLVEAFEEEARSRNAQQLKVTASVHSVGFYLSVGYKKTTGVRNYRGIRIQPMKKIFR